MKNLLRAPILCFALGASSHVAITLVNTDSARTGPSQTNPGTFPNDFTVTNPVGTRGGTYSYSYDAGAAFDVLVVSVSAESGGTTLDVNYNGVPMNRVVAGSASIWYLETSDVSGTIALNYLGTSPTVNGIGMGIAAISDDFGRSKRRIPH